MKTCMAVRGYFKNILLLLLTFIGLLQFITIWPLCLLARSIYYSKIQKERLRILYVSHRSILDGAPMSLLTFLSSMKNENSEVWVVSPHEGELLDSVRDLGFIAFSRKFSVLFLRRFKLLGVLRQFTWLRRMPRNLIFLMRKRFDIIHVNTIATPDLAVCGTFLKTPVIWHFRDPMFGRTWSFIQFFFLHFFSDKIITVSRFSQRQYLDFISKFGLKDKSTVIYNAVNPALFNSDHNGEEFRKELGIDTSVLLIGFAGTVTRHKGTDVFISAAWDILTRGLKEDRETFFVIVGNDEDPFSDEIREQIKKWGFGERIKMLGYRNDISDVLSALDICVVPSRIEPFGRVVIESMLLKVPVIGSRVGGITEIIEEGISGLLFEPEDVKDLVYKIETLVSDKNLYKRLVENGYRRVIENFTIERQREQILRIYEDIIKEKGTFGRFYDKIN